MQSDYKDYDWEKLKSKLPIEKTKEARAKRRELWKAIDANGNGYVSLAEFDRGIQDVLDLPKIFKAKKVVNKAFKEAKALNKSSSSHGDSYVEWLEFRPILVFLRQYFEYFVMFCRVDESDDFKINLKEFKAAIPTLEKWGIKVSDPEAEFKKIDNNNSGSIMFDEFCSWAIKQNLDLEDDDDFHDSEMKKMK